jgi:hypothetical protein
MEDYDKELQIVVCCFIRNESSTWERGIRINDNIIIDMDGRVVGDIWDICDIRMQYHDGTMIVRR